jgi:hypothetical protein
MSDAVALDIFIQDFVRSNKLLNQTLPWVALVNRRTAESAPLRIFRFESGGVVHLATATYMMLPEKDCLRIEFAHAIPVTEEHRFDYLRMISTQTHTHMTHSVVSGNMVRISLSTRHRGYIDVEVVIRGDAPVGEDPVCCGLTPRS